MEIKNIATILTFIVLIQLFSVYLTNEFVTSKILDISEYAFEPFGNQNVEQAGYNASFLIIVISIVTLALVLVIKLLGGRALRILLLAFSVFVVLIINDMYVAAILQNHLTSIYQTIWGDVISFTSTIILISLVVYATLTGKNRLLVISAFIILAEIGSFLAQTFVPPTLFIVMVAFALYDIFSVYLGPLKYFVRALGLPTKRVKGKAAKQISKLKKKINLGIYTTNIGGMLIGSGDLAFYSLAASAGFILAGIMAAISVIVVVTIGVWINHVLLERSRRVMPGLPVPIFLAMIPLLYFVYLV